MKNTAIATLLGDACKPLSAPSFALAQAVGEMRAAGAAHAEAGGMLTPHECQAIDARILAASKLAARPAMFYTTMRGAFNQGWRDAYARIVTAGGAR